MEPIQSFSYLLTAGVQHVRFFSSSLLTLLAHLPGDAKLAFRNASEFPAEPAASCTTCWQLHRLLSIYMLSFHHLPLSALGPQLLTCAKHYWRICCVPPSCSRSQRSWFIIAWITSVTSKFSSIKQFQSCPIYTRENDMQAHELACDHRSVSAS